MTYAYLMEIMNAELYNENIDSKKVNDALTKFVTTADLTLPNINAIIRNTSMETSENALIMLEEMRAQKELEQTIRMENIQVK